ncbi:hypothetical protein GYMLUDRAFT_160071, partial [Collybiopsis luxurians FD-317 M1]
GFDPKCTKCFNYVTVKAHFELLQKQVDMKNIQVQNMYNTDKIGIQKGGGRNGQAHVKFFYSATDKARYKMKSNN